MLFDELFAWGLLPIAVPLLLVCSHRLAWLVFPQSTRSAQLAGAAVFGMAMVHASVGLAAQLGVLSAASLLAILSGGAVMVSWAQRADSLRKLGIS